MKKDKDIACESLEEALARGMQVQRFEEGKVSKRELKKRNKEHNDDETEETEKIDLKLLISKCNPEQKKKLLKIAEEQGIDLDE